MMPEMNSNDLLKILDKILEYQKEIGNEEFKIEQDFYWHIRDKEKYNPYEKPTDMTLGQLTMDWDNLKEILEEKHEGIGYSLVWLGNILIAIGENYIE